MANKLQATPDLTKTVDPFEDVARGAAACDQWLRDTSAKRASCATAAQFDAQKIAFAQFAAQVFKELRQMNVNMHNHITLHRNVGD